MRDLWGDIKDLLPSDRTEWFFAGWIIFVVICAIISLIYTFGYSYNCPEGHFWSYRERACIAGFKP